jgi:hypothetical protein
MLIKRMEPLYDFLWILQNCIQEHWQIVNAKFYRSINKYSSIHFYSLFQWRSTMYHLCHKNMNFSLNLNTIKLTWVLLRWNFIWPSLHRIHLIPYSLALFNYIRKKTCWHLNYSVKIEWYVDLLVNELCAWPKKKSNVSLKHKKHSHVGNW